MRKTFRLAVLALVGAFAWPALAQEDARGSKDHPLLTRYPDSHIVEYVKNFNSVEFATGTKGGEPERKAVEGDATGTGCRRALVSAGIDRRQHLETILAREHRRQVEGRSERAVQLRHGERE